MNLEITKATRQSYGEKLAELGEKNKDIVVLDADLSGATKTSIFANKFPKRFFDMGISEQDMMSSHAGVTVGEDGATHQMIEDLEMMRGLPNMIVMCTSDDIETKWAVEEISKINGPVYLRLCRYATPLIYDEMQKFEFGKGVQIGEGKDATVFATGVTVSEAIKAKEELAKEGIDIRVVDIHTIKPIDKDLIIKCAKETRKLISVEDHSIIGGLRKCDFRNINRKLSSKAY